MMSSSTFSRSIAASAGCASIQVPPQSSPVSIPIAQKDESYAQFAGLSSSPTDFAFFCSDAFRSSGPQKNNKSFAPSMSSNCESIDSTGRFLSFFARNTAAMKWSGTGTPTN